MWEGCHVGRYAHDMDAGFLQSYFLPFMNGDIHHPRDHTALCQGMNTNQEVRITGHPLEGAYHVDREVGQMGNKMMALKL